MLEIKKIKQEAIVKLVSGTPPKYVAEELGLSIQMVEDWWNELLPSVRNKATFKAEANKRAVGILAEVLPEVTPALVEAKILLLAQDLTVLMTSNVDDCDNILQAKVLNLNADTLNKLLDLINKMKSNTNLVEGSEASGDFTSFLQP